MRYRAQLLGVERLERPRQIYGTNLDGLKDWGHAELEGLNPEEQKNAHVVIYQSTEVVVADLRLP